MFNTQIRQSKSNKKIGSRLNMKNSNAWLYETTKRLQNNCQEMTIIIFDNSIGWLLLVNDMCLIFHAYLEWGYIDYQTNTCCAKWNERGEGLNIWLPLGITILVCWIPAKNLTWNKSRIDPYWVGLGVYGTVKTATETKSREKVPWRS